jgi:hypothetical protein
MFVRLRAPRLLRPSCESPNAMGAVEGPVQVQVQSKSSPKGPVQRVQFRGSNPEGPVQRVQSRGSSPEVMERRNENFSGKKRCFMHLLVPSRINFFVEARSQKRDHRSKITEARPQERDHRSEITEARPQERNNRSESGTSHGCIERKMTEFVGIGLHR